MFDDVNCLSPKEQIFHDARGTNYELASTKRFAIWLKAAMSSKGLTVSGRDPDEGGLVHYIVGNNADDSEQLCLIVMELGGAPEDVSAIVEGILRETSQITDLR